MARAVEQHKTKPAKRTSRRRTSRQSGRASRAVSSDLLSIVEDVFPRWRGRLESSREAADKLEALLRNSETRSAFVSASGELWPLDGEFWRDMARLEVVPDADFVGDRLEVCRPTYVNGDGPFSDSPGGRFLVRRLNVERWEGLYFPMTAAPPLATGKERKPTPKKKRRKAKQASRSGAPEQHDWEEGELFAMQELETRGNPLDKNNQTKEWKTISDLARLVRNHLKDVSKDKDYAGPDMSTARGKASDFIKKFERERKLQASGP